MRRAVGLALTLALTALPAGAHADPTGRVLVSASTPGAYAARAETAIPQLGVVALRPPAGVTPRALVRRLRADPRVRYAELEHRFELRYEPNDPALHALEPAGTDNLGLQWALERQNFPAAWDATRGEQALVAVIDTGIDGTHPDLDGKLAQALDFDDTSQDSATVDRDGHGTHVASLACAATDNGIGIAGAGFGCRLLVIKSDLTDGSVARAIVAAADAGAHAINMSFGDDGGHPSQAIADAVQYALDRDVVLVAAAADQPVEEQGEPANLLEPSGRGLSVTAADGTDARAQFAGRGPQVSLAAYGALRSDPESDRGLFALYPATLTPREQPTVIPPDPGCRCRASFADDDRYAFLAGTSMAAPHVAAVAAMMRALNPDVTAEEVVRLVKETARRPAGSGRDPDLGWGILDAGAAVGAARRVDRTAPVSRALAVRHARRSRTVVVRWRGSDPAPDGLLASGVARYEVYRAVGRGRPRRIASTPATRRRVRVRPGRYAFFTVAVDRAGNREPAPARPDARVRVR